MNSSQLPESLSISEIKEVQTYLKQAETHKKQGQWEQAISCYQRATEINPNSSAAYHYWGNALLNLDRWQEAINIYRRSLEINPNFDWSYYNLGEALIQLGRWEEAIVAYQRALDLNPSLPAIYKKLANAFYQRAISDRSSLLEYYQQAIADDPNEIQNYHRAIELQTQDAELYLGLGNALAAQERLDEAMVAYQMALQIQPDRAEAREQLDKILQTEDEANQRQDNVSLGTESSLEQAKILLDRLNNLALDTWLQSGGQLVFPAVENPTVSIILILYNRAELTLSCLQSILHHSYKSVEVTIVDNCSSDRTRELLTTVSGANIILNQSNRHFLLAANQAAATATGKHLLFLNNDAQILGDSINQAIKTLESAGDIGAVGGKIILPDGTLQEAGSIVWQDGSCLGYGRGDAPDAYPYMFQRTVDYCSGAFLLTKRELFEQLGGFDEVYQPAYYEETDYCLKLQQAGYKVVYEPKVVILHYEFASSTSSKTAIALQQRNQQIFVEQHQQWLQSQYPVALDRLLFARISAKDQRQRILFIDDRIPHPYLGSGYTRSHSILNTMVALGYLVTFYPTDLSYQEDWQTAYADINPAVEIAQGHGLQGLADFLRTRTGYYSQIFVSRPHNMNHLNYILSQEDLLAETKIIYDAEALYSLRDFAYQELQGTPVRPEAQQRAIAEELNLARKSDVIVSVSPREQQQFVDYGYELVEVLGHALEVSPTPNSFGDRQNILFVGSVYELASPNADSILWLAEEIFPQIQEQLGTQIKLIIAGTNNVTELQEKIAALDNRAIEMQGRVEDLTALYNRARLFVAPTRFAAGIPHKVHEAAAKGVPVVSTSLIANQLQWQTETELLTADNAADFAQQCVKLYQDAELWQKLRLNALEKIAQQCSTEYFRATLKQILN